MYYNDRLLTARMSAKHAARQTAELTSRSASLYSIRTDRVAAGPGNEQFLLRPLRLD